MDSPAVLCLCDFCALLSDYLRLFSQDAESQPIAEKSALIDALVLRFQSQYPNPREIEGLDPLGNDAPTLFCYLALTYTWPWMRDQYNLRDVLKRGNEFETLWVSLRCLQRSRFWKRFFKMSQTGKGRAVGATVLYMYFRRPPFAMLNMNLQNFFAVIIGESKDSTGFPDMPQDFKALVTAMCKTPLVQEAAGRLGLNFHPFVDVLVNNTFYSPMDCFNGFTCFGDFIAIKYSYYIDTGATLILFLHEMTHIVKKYRDKSLEADHPNEEFQRKEDSVLLEKLLFGSEVTLLYPEAERFLMNRANWDQDLGTFVKGFQTAQKTGTDNRSKPTDFSQVNGAIGDCAFGMRYAS